MIDAAKAWIKANPESAQPWDKPGYRILAAPVEPEVRSNAASVPANLRKQPQGAPMPAPKAIMSAAVEGSQVDFETANKIETPYFVDLLTGQIAKNMIQAFFFDLQKITKGGARPDGYDKFRATKVVVWRRNDGCWNRLRLRPRRHAGCAGRMLLLSLLKRARHTAQQFSTRRSCADG